MDTLDKITSVPTKRYDEPARDGSLAADVDAIENDLDDAVDKAKDVADTAKDAAEDAAGKINWWKVAGYVAAGTAVAVAVTSYVRWRSEQAKPKTRLGQLRDKLGLSDVDFRDLKSSLNRVDFEKLDQSRRELGSYAKQVAHKSAKKVAELTK